MTNMFNFNNKNIYVICEISGNHKNSFKHIKSFLNKIIQQKVDFVKFQVYKPEILTINTNKKDFRLDKNNSWNKYKNLYQLFSKSYTPWDWIEKSIKILNKKKINWFASPFDKSSVDFLEKLRCKIYKIASPEITDVNLIEYIAKKKKPMIISTGMSDLKDLDLAIKVIKKYHNKYAILKCTSNYPARYKDLNLSSIPKLKSKYKCPVGFSDHTVDRVASIGAVSLGATIIEKHFKMDEDQKSVDNHFSMNISDYSKFKFDLENSKKSLGNIKQILKVSKEKKNQRRSLYISKPIKKNEKLNLTNIKSVRPGFSLHPKYLKKILGKKTKIDLEIGSRIKLKFLK
jgi:pseudaminic acid synthase